MAKVITLKQPWAQLVVIGAKQFETRGFKTDYRGPLYIHTSSSFDYRHLLMSLDEPFKSALKENPNRLNVGKIIGKVELCDCLPADLVRGVMEDTPMGKKELAFGDFSDGRWAWLLSHPVKFERPLKAAGKLGIWDYDIDESIIEGVTHG